MADDVERARNEFVGRAPELRRALVAELSALISRAATLTSDEASILHHVLAYAGYSLDGGLYIPAFAVLWGGEDSYIPAVHLPAERVRAAASTLRRRGILRDIRWNPGEASGHTDGVFVEADALRALAGRTEPASKRRVILYIAASVDGFIAKTDGDIAWLSQVDAPPEDYGYAEFVKTVDTVIMGRKTYDKVLGFGAEFPHKDRKVFVLSRKKKGADANVTFASGDPAKLIARLRKQEGKDIFCDGGAQVVHALLKKDLIDVLVVSLIPVLLGDGIPLFKKGRPERRLKLIESRSFPTGLVQLRYERA
jgi:dihydrofolate reductase